MNVFSINPSDVLRISHEFSSITTKSNPLDVFEKNEDNFTVIMNSLTGARDKLPVSNTIHTSSLIKKSNHSTNIYNQNNTDVLTIDSEEFMKKIFQPNEEENVDIDNMSSEDFMKQIMNTEHLNTINDKLYSSEDLVREDDRDNIPEEDQPLIKKPKLISELLLTEDNNSDITVIESSESSPNLLSSNSLSVTKIKKPSLKKDSSKSLESKKKITNT